MENKPKSPEEILAYAHFDKVNSHMSEEDREYFKKTGESLTIQAYLAGFKAASQAKDEVIRNLSEQIKELLVTTLPIEIVKRDWKPK